MKRHIVDIIKLLLIPGSKKCVFKPSYVILQPMFSWLLKFYFGYLEEKYILLYNKNCCMDIITINIFISWQYSSLLMHLSLLFHERNGASLIRKVLTTVHIKIMSVWLHLRQINMCHWCDLFHLHILFVKEICGKFLVHWIVDERPEYMWDLCLWWYLVVCRKKVVWVWFQIWFKEFQKGRLCHEGCVMPYWSALHNQEYLVESWNQHG